MIAKEKADELIEKMFSNMPKYLQGKIGSETAKQCALICVGEILKLAYDIEWEKQEEAISKLKFLKEVKQEINKL